MNSKNNDKQLFGNPFKLIIGGVIAGLTLDNVIGTYRKKGLLDSLHVGRTCIIASLFVGSGILLKSFFKPTENENRKILPVHLLIGGLFGGNLISPLYEAIKKQKFNFLRECVKFPGCSLAGISIFGGLGLM
jgi:hypothetical protein